MCLGRMWAIKYLPKKQNQAPLAIWSPTFSPVTISPFQDKLAACRKETWICLPTSGSLDAAPWSRWKTAATAEQLVRYTEKCLCMSSITWSTTEIAFFSRFLMLYDVLGLDVYVWLVYQCVPPTSRTLPGGSELGQIPPENKSLHSLTVDCW